MLKIYFIKPDTHLEKDKDRGKVGAVTADL
jgi:hypothetical protein